MALVSSYIYKLIDFIIIQKKTVLVIISWLTVYNIYVHINTWISYFTDTWIQAAG